MDIFIKLLTVGANAGPFMIYSNLSNYAYGVQVTKADLLNGITITMPNGTTSVRIRSNGKCTNDIIVNVSSKTTTTTTTTHP